MDAREQEEAVLAAIADGIVSSRQVHEVLPELSVRKVAATMGRLRAKGLVRRGETRCSVCDGRGRVALWQQTRSPEGPS